MPKDSDLDDFTWFLASEFRQRMPLRLKGSEFEAEFKISSLFSLDLGGDQSYEEIQEFLRTAVDCKRLLAALKSGMNDPTLKNLVFRKAVRLAESDIDDRSFHWRKELIWAEARHANLWQEFMKTANRFMESVPRFESFKEDFIARAPAGADRKRLEVDAIFEFSREVDWDLDDPEYKRLVRAGREVLDSAWEVGRIRKRRSLWSASWGWRMLRVKHLEDIKSVVFEATAIYRDSGIADSEPNTPSANWRERETVSHEEAGRVLGRTTRTIRRYVKSGKLRQNRVKRIIVASLEELLS